jgi:hypothetical protein
MSGKVLSGARAWRSRARNEARIGEGVVTTLRPFGGERPLAVRFDIGGVVVEVAAD